MKLDSRKARWFYVVVWMIVIFAFSHQPHSGRITEQYLGDNNVPIRKLAHVTEFLMLFLLVRWALLKQFSTTFGERMRGNQMIGLMISPSTLAAVFAVAYAATDEWHQSFVPGRSSNWNDVAVDACGVFLGALVLALVTRMRKKRRAETASEHC